MFRKIIIPTEVSAAAISLLNRTKFLRDVGTEEVLLLLCVRQCDVDQLSESFVDSVLASNLKYQVKILEDQGFKADTKIVRGVPANEVNRVAQTDECSIVVTGAQKHTAASEIFFGGLAYEMIHHSHKPTLIIRLPDKADDFTEQSPGYLEHVEHILFPTDFSLNADHAFEYVKHMVQAGIKKVTLLHVQDRARFDNYSKEQIDEFDQRDQRRLMALRDELSEMLDVEISTVICHGAPTSEILKKAEELNPDLVVLGSQGKGFVQEIFIGSVSRDIARHSDSSVLLVPLIRTIM